MQKSKSNQNPRLLGRMAGTWKSRIISRLGRGMYMFVLVTVTVAYAGFGLA